MGTFFNRFAGCAGLFSSRTVERNSSSFPENEKSSSSMPVFVAASERHRTIANNVKRNATSLCDSEKEEEEEEVREGGRGGILLLLLLLVTILSFALWGKSVVKCFIEKIRIRNTHATIRARRTLEMSKELALARRCGVASSLSLSLFSRWFLFLSFFSLARVYADLFSLSLSLSFFRS